jgi:subtilase family serine protease
MNELRSIRKLRVPVRSARAPHERFSKRFSAHIWASLLIFGTVAASGVERHSLGGHVPEAFKSLVSVDTLPASARLDLCVGLPLRNQEGLTNLLEQLYDPASPLYHHYLTPQQFADQFGPDEQDCQALIRFFESKRLTVTGTHANRLVMEVSGAVSDIEAAFATRLRVYPHPKENRRFFAPEQEPSIDPGVPMLDISGLDNFVLPHPTSLHPAFASRSAVPNAGSASGGSYRGKDFRAAYLPGVALSGAGQLVGLIEFDGYYPGDITTYETDAGLPNVPLQNVLLSGFSGSPGDNNAEVALDIEVAISVAPGLSGVMIYEGMQPNTLLNRMATDNRAKQLSSSWTFGINATTENIFREFAAQGQSMFQASGDNGAYSAAVDTPADDPSVTVVGGTSLSTIGPAGAWLTETTWNWALSGMGTNASGGGVSTTYAIPSYQKGINMSHNGGSTNMRNVPDVSMAADNIWVVWNNGSTGSFGGTSAAAPLWAAFMALVNQQAVANGNPTVGFANPALYAIGTGTNYSACFHDIATGNNKNVGSPNKFSAVAGYDLCTGWGTPGGQSLINALAGIPNFTNAIPATSAQISLQSNALMLKWNGGVPPFQVQSCTNLASGIWQNVGALTSNYSLAISPGAPAATYRIQSIAP